MIPGDWRTIVVEPPRFTFEDMLGQLRRMRVSPALRQARELLKGCPNIAPLTDAQIAEIETQERQIEAMITSMTPYERRNPEKIDAHRCARIAAGAGAKVADVQKLVLNFPKREGAR